MLNLPLEGEILELLIVKFLTIIRNQYLWNTMASKLHLELSKNSLCCLLVDLNYFKEIGPVIHYHQKCLLTKDKQIGGNLLPRV